MKTSYKLTPEQEAILQKALVEGREKYKSIEHIIIESNIDCSGIFDYEDGIKQYDELTAREKWLLAQVAEHRAKKKNQDLLEGDDRKYVRKLELGPEPKDEEEYTNQEIIKRTEKILSTDGIKLSKESIEEIVDDLCKEKE